MKITKLLAIALLPSLWYYAQAQEQTTSTEENQKEAASPLKNKVSIAATRVYNNQLSTQLIDPSSSSVTVTAPFAEGKNDAFLALEVGWYVSDSWRLNLTTGFNFSKNPGYTKKEGVDSPINGLPATVPEFTTIPERHSMGLAVTLGSDRFFHTEYLPNLVWFVGGRFGYSFVHEGYNKNEALNYGPAQAQTFRFRVAAAVGADYYLIPEKLFVGVQVDPLSYSYGVYTAKSRPSVGARSADTHHFNFLGGPNYNVDLSFKLGLNF